MHKVAPEIEVAITIPFLHIDDASAAAIRDQGVTSVALLGTKYTMEQDFYRGRLEKNGLRVIVPSEADRTLVHDVIFHELTQGRIIDASRARYLEIIGDLYAQGAEGVIAGCTEIELLVTPDDVDGPYFPTTRIHAIAAVDAALS